MGTHRLHLTGPEPRVIPPAPTAATARPPRMTLLRGPAEDGSQNRVSRRSRNGHLAATCPWEAKGRRSAPWSPAKILVVLRTPTRPPRDLAVAMTGESCHPAARACHLTAPCRTRYPYLRICPLKQTRRFGHSNVLTTQSQKLNERSGDRIVAGESDKDSRFERLRKKGFEKGEDTLGTANKATNRAQDLLGRQPPAGHAETRSGPDVSAAPHQGIDGGDALAAVLMVGVLFDDAIRRVHKKATQKKELDDAGDR
jgi:hypothetical protein